MATLYVYGFKTKSVPVAVWDVTTSLKDIEAAAGYMNSAVPPGNGEVWEPETLAVTLSEEKVRRLIGQLAGGLSTEKKAAAARENGKKSRGRPRKTEKPKPKTTPKKARIDPVDKEIPELDLK